MRPTVLDLFAGCGGMSYGFVKAGYHIAYFVEQWEPAIQTYLKNHPEAKLLGKDIREITNEQLAPLAGEIDIIIGGPPCQGFSLCGKREKGDQRNNLYKEYLRFVQVIKPTFAVMENVAGLLSMQDEEGKLVLTQIVKDFIKAGYWITYKILSADEYGVPQKRKRLFLLAKRADIFPHPKAKRVSVLEALGTLPHDENGLNGHIVAATTKENKARIRRLKPGEKLYTRFNFAPVRLYASKPSRTVTTRDNLIHPIYHRYLTPRECARLQSFPDDFEFCGNKTAMLKQVGNAVPPLLAQAIAEKLLEGVV